MSGLCHGVFGIPDVFGVECSIEFEEVFDWDLVTQGIVVANGYDEGAEECLDGYNTIFSEFSTVQPGKSCCETLAVGLRNIPCQRMRDTEERFLFEFRCTAKFLLAVMSGCRVFGGGNN